MGMRMVCIEDDGVVRIAADGPITSENFVSVNDNPLEGLLGAAWYKHRVLLDLKEADYIDSSAVGWLLNCQRAFQASGGQIVLHSVQPRVARLLGMLRLDTVVPVAADERAARISLRKEAA